MALMFTTVVVGVVVTGTLTLKSQITTNRTLFITNYQAVMAARSGLTEALSWLRRQTSQPVTQFAPILAEGAIPPVLDTEDPGIGLVRDFQISGSLWARYEVWKEWASDPNPDRLAWRQQFQCEDISEPKAGRDPGAAWRLRRRLEPRRRAVTPSDLQAALRVLRADNYAAVRSTTSDADATHARLNTALTRLLRASHERFQPCLHVEPHAQQRDSARVCTLPSSLLPTAASAARSTAQLKKLRAGET